MFTLPKGSLLRFNVAIFLVCHTMSVSPSICP